jgi:hypothetical protein
MVGERSGGDSVITAQTKTYRTLDTLNR